MGTIVLKMCEAARHASDAAENADHGASHAMYRVVIQTTERNGDNFIFYFGIGNLILILKFGFRSLQ